MKKLTKAAKAAPTNGATMNTQTWCKGSPNNQIAGAKERAGLTEVPVNLIPKICTKVKV